MNKNNIMFYIVGIKGAGCCALANILQDLNYEVRGTDYSEEYFTDSKLNKNIVVDTFENMIYDDMYIYIIGNAYLDSKYLNKIKDYNLSYYTYPEFLEKFFKQPHIGISGSHGKTSTINYINCLCNKPLNILIGDGTGKGNINSEYFVFEACEYKDHFLSYTYDYLLINNIDYDHPDYFKNKLDYINSFVEATKKAKVTIINIDDENAKKLITKNSITYGFSKEADCNIELNDDLVTIKYQDIECKFRLKLYGIHQYSNLCGAILVSIIMKEDLNNILNNIKYLKNPTRRLNFIKEVNTNFIYDDYAHHPTEIKASINALRNMHKNKKIIIIFEPHTLSRTLAFLEDFINALMLADEVYLLPVFTSVRENKSKKDNILQETSNFKSYNEFNINNYQNSIICYMGAGKVNYLI